MKRAPGLDASHTGLRRFIFACLAGLLLTAGTLVFQIASARTEASDLHQRVKALTAEAAAIQGEVDRAKLIQQDVPNPSMSPISRLEGRLRDLAHENRCTVTEFRASTETVPYLTRFAKRGDEEGWVQVESQVSLKGQVRSIVATINELGDQEIPFEFNSIEISRNEVSELGVATVLAKVSFRILVRRGAE